jgi:hypothetical protein
VRFECACWRIGAVRLQRTLRSGADVLGGAVVVLLLLNPARPLATVFALLGAAVVLLLLPALPPGKD